LFWREGKKMKDHVEHLLDHFPDLLDFFILDLGSGKGRFLNEIAGRGGQAVGLEINDAYIKETHERAAQKGLSVQVIKGAAEHLPFGDATFDFVNFALVVEHVEDPRRAIKEMSRVIKSGGQAYMGVPNRFGFKDPHFHLYFVNWLPRSWCKAFINLFSELRDYHSPAGRQNLDEMHYFTYGQIKKILNNVGFQVIDVREKKIKKIFKNSFISRPFLFLYRFYRFLFSDSFHLLLKKN